MSIKTCLFIAFMFMQQALAHAQVLNGVVKDAKTSQNLAYVNVGIIGKGIGTVTGTDGHFALTLNNNAADSLRISMIGYLPQTFLVSKFKPGAAIALVPDVRQLSEVKISGRKLKESILGNKTRSKTTDAGFNSNELGNEIGEMISIKRSPTYLKQFNASIARETSDTVKLRLNFYSVKNGRPDTILQQQNIFIKVQKGQDNISVDLTPYHIVVTNKFFVSLEWIENAPGPGLMFSASLLSSPIISRETSQANWEKIGIAGIGFNILAAY
jgi:hypothetical protein